MFRLGRLCVSIVGLCALIAVVPRQVRGDEEEYDNSRYKLQLNGWISAPTGYFNGPSHDGYFDLQKDFGFGNYATFSGKFDWRFKRKHHLLFTATPVISSRTTTLTRTIVWQGQTYDIGARVNADIKSFIFAPGYQWDFIRRKSGRLALLVKCNRASSGIRSRTTAGFTSMDRSRACRFSDTAISCRGMQFWDSRSRTTGMRGQGICGVAA